MTEYDALFAKARAIAEERGQLYGSVSDPLANVNRAAALMGDPPWRQALSGAAEAIARLMIADERGLLTFPRAEEWLRDAANFLNFAYLDLMKGAASDAQAAAPPEFYRGADFVPRSVPEGAETIRLPIVPEYLDGPLDLPLVASDDELYGRDHAEYRADHAHDERASLATGVRWPNHRHLVGSNGFEQVIYATEADRTEALPDPWAAP